LIILLFLLVAPITLSATRYLFGDRAGHWQTADRSSSGLLPEAAAHPDALVRIYAARTVRWRGGEGIEINFLGAVIGIDLRRPALKLPGLGRIGFNSGMGTCRI
jgi:hypothetical protein